MSRETIFLTETIFTVKWVLTSGFFWLQNFFFQTKSTYKLLEPQHNPVQGSSRTMVCKCMVSKKQETSSVFLGIFFVFRNISAYISLKPQFNADQSFLGYYGLKMYPFCEEEPMLTQILSKHDLNENTTSSAKRSRKVGLNQSDSFINDWLLNGTASL